MEKSLTRRRVVVSAVNFIEGGPLTILRECLASAVESLSPDWEIVALVNRRELIDQPGVRLIPIPSAKRSWLHRIYWEWQGFRRLSTELKPNIWLSLHDVTPNVLAHRQAVYCHNPAPFYKISLREAYLEPKFWLFNRLYYFLYRAFIRRNHCVVVQQGWMRDAFRRRMGPLPLVVAHPSLRAQEPPEMATEKSSIVIFLYPSLPRVFKNFETVCDAARRLAERGCTGFEVRLTLSGAENRYAQWLRARYGSMRCLRFIGRLEARQMAVQYGEATAVLFASKLETWGLPISEAIAYGKPLIVADLPYARETVGNYENVCFFPATAAAPLADLMQSIIERRWKPQGASATDPAPPFAANWGELWRLLVEGVA
jgi:glycosyltransferase involved in cell wall biosynthesis